MDSHPELLPPSSEAIEKSRWFPRDPTSKVLHFTLAPRAQVTLRSRSSKRACHPEGPHAWGPARFWRGKRTEGSVVALRPPATSVHQTGPRFWGRLTHTSAPYSHNLKPGRCPRGAIPSGNPFQRKPVKWGRQSEIQSNGFIS